MRALLIALALMLCLGGIAAAQRPQVQVIDPATQGAPKVVPMPGPGATSIETPATVTAPKERDRAQGHGTGMALVFWACALAAVGGSIFVITRRNLIAAVMGMVGTFVAIAALYMLLYANFVAVIQMMVYAGAIMVLFVFVVMVINKPEDEPWGGAGIPGKIFAGLAMLYLTFRLGQTVWSVKVDAAALTAPAPVSVSMGKSQQPYDWGSPGAVGDSLFDEYLFPFEAISILLLAAVVGAIAVARPWKESGAPDDHVDDGAAPDGAGGAGGVV